MKGSWKVFLIILMTAITACDKEETSNSKITKIKTQEHSPAALHNAIFASEWQTLDQWDKDDEGFHASRHLPIKTDGGKVLLFARNVWALDVPMEDPMEDIPLQLPFNFLPYTDQPGLTETWQYAVNGNQVKIDLQVKGGAVQGQPRPVQVRALYIPDSVWQNLLRSGVGEQDIAYESLVEHLAINP